MTCLVKLIQNIRPLLLPHHLKYLYQKTLVGGQIRGFFLWSIGFRVAGCNRRDIVCNDRVMSGLSGLLGHGESSSRMGGVERTEGEGVRCKYI